MNIYFLAEASAGTLAIFYAVIFTIAAFLAVCWIAFPFIVLSKFNELLKVARKTERHAEQTTFALTSLKSALNETNKALQYLVDSGACDSGVSHTAAALKRLD